MSSLSAAGCSPVNHQISGQSNERTPLINKKSYGTIEGNNASRSSDVVIDMSRSAIAVIQDVGETLSYADISRQNLVATAGKPDPKIPTSPMGDPAKFVLRWKALLLSILPRVRDITAFRILENAEKDQPVPAPCLDKRTWLDLNILSGSEHNPEIYLGSLISRTHTQLGKSLLLGTIARPHTEVNLLKRRQFLIKELLGPRNELCRQLDGLLQGMDEPEGQLLSFWNNGIQLPGTIHNQYWKFNESLDEWLNNSNIALDIKASWMGIQKLLTAGIQTSSAALLPIYAALALSQSQTDIEPPEFLHDYQTRFTGTAGPAYALLTLLKQSWINAGAALTAGLLTGLALKSTLKWTKADLSTDALIQNKLVLVARYYRKMKETYEVLQANYAFAQNFEHFQELKGFFQSEDHSIKKLRRALESNTFNSEASFFFRRGNVLLAFKLLEDEEVQKKFEKALTAMAEIDMHISIVKLIQHFQDKRIHYCFPTYLENENKPFIHLTNFWNPFVDPEMVVPNSITLGANPQSRNAVVTGPNSGGKSSGIKGVVYPIILAQSLGIAPASEMNFTPFANVRTYMDITDDISNKTSLFQSEIDRSITVYKKISLMARGQFSFTMFDELFSGTSPKEGMSIAYVVADELGKLPNSICMVATHYSLLTDLEKTGNFTNYKVSVEQIADRIIRKYKLERGISDQHIALAVARERGISSGILDLAQAILQKLQKQ